MVEVILKRFEAEEMIREGTHVTINNRKRRWHTTTHLIAGHPGKKPNRGSSPQSQVTSAKLKNSQ